MAFFPYGWVRHLICDNVVHLTVYGEKLWKVYGLCHFPSDYQKATTKNKRINLSFVCKTTVQINVHDTKKKNLFFF